MSRNRLRLLVIEDRAWLHGTIQQVVGEFAELQHAVSVEEAKRVIEGGWMPSIVLSDLHLQDGRPPVETIARVFDLVDPDWVRVVFMTAAPDQEFRDMVTRRFGPSVELLSKQGVELINFLQGLRIDGSGRAKTTMDEGTHSDDRIRKIAREEIEQHRGESWFMVQVEKLFKTLHVPSLDWVRDRVKSALIYDGRIDTVSKAVLGGLVFAVVLGLLGWIGPLIWSGFLQGPEP